MREIGPIIWFILLVVGVGGSMVSSIRKMRGQTAGPPLARSAAPAAPRRVAPPQRQPTPPAPRPPAPPAPSRPAASPVQAPRHEPELGGLPAQERRFRDRRDLVRAVIGAEVLGKPRALRDEYFEA